MEITQKMRQNQRENEYFYRFECKNSELVDEILVASSYDEAESELLNYYEIEALPFSCTLEKIA